ncbi:hypothetical protein DMENIID0001_127820 [Sergentomyia squamirostris]
MESVAKVIPVESPATRDANGPEYTEDITEQENCAESCQHDSEYNTASDSTTSDAGIEKVGQKIEVIEISDDEENEDEEGPEDDDDDEEEGDEGSSVESADGEEDDEDAENIQEIKRQVDDDEDRSNPQYIPKRGTFYEHDDRTAENADGQPEAAQNEIGGESQEKKVSFNAPPPAVVKPPKKWQAAGDRWSHDRYDECEQAPKSKAELVSAYGYDIRNEESPPRARRRRRYGRGPSKYTRKWEDENAYSKPTSRRIALNSKDEFPEIEDNSMGRSKRRGERKNVTVDDAEYYGNRQYSDDGGNYGRGGSHENNQLKPRNQPSSGFRVKSSIEFKNQNRLRQNTNIEHNRSDSFVITRNNNVTGGQIEENLEGQLMDHVDEPHSRSADYKSQHHQQHHPSQQVHGVNGNEFSDFVPNYLHNQMSPEQQHALRHSQQNMLLSRDLQLNYGGDSVKMLQQQTQPPTVRGHQATATVPGSLIGMGVNSETNMRQTPKRYSSLRQRAVMSNNAQQQMMPEMEERLKKKYDTMPVQQEQQHHEIVDTAKLKMRQSKTLPPPQPPPSQQPPILTPSTPQASNYYAAAPEYIRQPPMPAHRPAPPAAAKNHASLPGPAYQAQFAATNPAPPFVPPPAQTTPAFITPPPPPQSTNPQQIINYVATPTMPPPTAQPPQYPPYPNYQNFNAITTPSIPHQSHASGITYYAPQSQPPPRPVVSQRRPTNAIPILAPPERSGNGKGRGRLPAGSQPGGDESDPNSEGKNNSENIDHILDNMFVRRTPYEQPSLKPSTSPPVSPVTVKGVVDTTGGGVDQIEEAVKNLSVGSSEQQPLLAATEAPSPVTSVRTDETASSGGHQETVQDDK